MSSGPISIMDYYRISCKGRLEINICIYIYIRLKNMSTDNFCGEVVINFSQT